jgi:hypothetical protein
VVQVLVLVLYIVRILILIMSKSGFEDEILIKLIVGVVKHEACHLKHVPGKFGNFFFYGNFFKLILNKNVIII